MDPRDINLIKTYGTEMTRYFGQLAKDPSLNLLDQIRYSEVIEQIRRRSHFRQKRAFTDMSEIS